MGVLWDTKYVDYYSKTGRELLRWGFKVSKIDRVNYSTLIRNKIRMELEKVS